MVLHSYAPEWSYQETKERILAIEDRTTRYFAGVAYSLGARLNEARKLSPKDINIVQNKNKEDRILVSLFTLKNNKVEKRPIPINPIEEKEYAEMFFDIKKNFEPNELVFQDLSTRTFQRRLKKYLDIHPHALRHLRVHHVDDKEIPGMQGLTPRQFKDLFGWALIETSAHYQSRTRGRDLTDLF